MNNVVLIIVCLIVVVVFAWFIFSGSSSDDQVELVSTSPIVCGDGLSRRGDLTAYEKNSIIAVEQSGLYESNFQEQSDGLFKIVGPLTDAQWSWFDVVDGDNGQSLRLSYLCKCGEGFKNRRSRNKEKFQRVSYSGNTIGACCADPIADDGGCPCSSSNYEARSVSPNPLFATPLLANPSQFAGELAIMGFSPNIGERSHMAIWRDSGEGDGYGIVIAIGTNGTVKYSNDNGNSTRDKVWMDGVPVIQIDGFGGSEMENTEAIWGLEVGAVGDDVAFEFRPNFEFSRTSTNAVPAETPTYYRVRDYDICGGG